MEAYNPEQIQAALGESAVACWQLDEATGEIFKEYRFPDFVTAMAFVDRLAGVAEELAHHPDILIRYNRVRLSVLTHDAGNGLTEIDFKLAAEANALEKEENTL
jgi:4a-hydroxytetrahydrobiopterin dehydratase